MDMTVEQLLKTISDARTRLEYAKMDVINILLDAERDSQVSVSTLTDTAMIFNKAVFEVISILSVTAVKPTAWIVEIRRDDDPWKPCETIHWDIEDAELHRDSWAADDGPEARLVPLYRGK